MTRTAAAAGVTRAGHIGNGPQSARRDLVFNCAFGNKETCANQRFVARPLIARGIAVLANGRQQRVARQLRTMLPRRLQTNKTTPQLGHVLRERRSFGRRCAHHVLRQQRRRRDQHTTTRSLKFRLRNHVFVADLNRKPHVRAADQRRSSTHKTWLVRIAHISRIKEMIGGYFRRN